MKNKIHAIFHKGNSETATETERQEMLSLFHRPEKEFVVKKELQKDLEKKEISEEYNPNLRKLFAKIWAKIESNERQQTSKTRYLPGLLKIAAALIAGLVIGIYASSVKTVPQEPVYYAAHSPKGSVSEMILPDGSVIFLNADSKIRYSVEGKGGIREVFLEGEAWFDVAKDENKPFVVHTPFYKVNVTGTKFNVKAYDSDNCVTTTLEEGQVIVQSGEKLTLAENFLLKPGEQIIFDKLNKSASVKQVNTTWFTSWKDNKLIFVNMNLDDLVVLLERKYGVDIEVKNKEILQLHFDGTIKNESIIEILEIVKKTLPINYKIVGQKIEITNNKNKR